MPKTTQYVFTLEELTAMLVERAGVTEGNWRLYVEFGLGVSHLASPTSKEEVAPGIIAVLKHVGITEAPDVVPGITVDASTGQAVKVRSESPESE